MSELVAIYLMFFLLYVGGAALTGYLMGRARPNTSWDELTLASILLWIPFGLPFVLGLMAFNEGQAEVRYKPLKKGDPDDDGWHEYEDGNMLVRWKEKS